MTVHSSVFEAIAAVMGSIEGFVEKTESKALGYSFASVEDMIAAIRPQMKAHGLVLMPSGVRDLMVSREKNDKGTMITSVSATYTFMFLHTSGTYITAEVASEAKDTSDKALNKAATQAFKTCIKQTFMIETVVTAEAQRRKRGGGSGDPNEVPMSAGHFKKAVVEGAQKINNSMPLSPKQISYLASVMTEAYKDIEGSSDQKRYAVLSRLFDREIKSSGNLILGEFEAIINRVTGEDGKLTPRGKQELINVYKATFANQPASPDRWDERATQALWTEANAAGITPNQLFDAADTVNSEEFYVKLTPSQAGQLLSDMTGKHINLLKAA